ncbi:isochorismate synthase MenF [Smaragdicoccus niigatensis]|uniref:isochorismate synthase n=1 Tax=Smaragdicoccus niigatensis TaxID=359359 RepID=UPI000378D064|nr:isochorismate synthase [Smaragdicoccus niigatensis]
MDGFLLARAGSVVRATGARETFQSVHEAGIAIRTQRDAFIAGALPFDPTHPTALFRAGQVTRRSITPVQHDPIALSVVAENPTPAEHSARVAGAIERIRAGELEKVVLARSIDVAANAAIDPVDFALHAAVRYPTGNVFAVDLSAAGSDHVGTTLIGASPEVLVSRRGRSVTLKPLAGSTPRGTDPESDEANAQKLLDSDKNLEEHAYVIEYLRDRLSGVCTEIDVPAGPILASTPHVWHLATPIRATLAEPATTALDLAALLHPTPAVGGTPTDSALEAIREIEGDRGFYAGAVGWCDAQGDGDWIVSIRCAVLSPNGFHARLYAGGGIVASSDPADELAETTAKLRTLRGLLSFATD